MDAGASEENRMVVLLPGSGGLRTPAEKCRPPGYNRTAERGRRLRVGRSHWGQLPSAP